VLVVVFLELSMVMSISEQLNVYSMEREIGYYWCRSITTTPQIGYWDGKGWTFCGNDMEFISSTMITPINETRIPSPDEFDMVVKAVNSLVDVHTMD
jgi:hypothetical protein